MEFLAEKQEQEQSQTPGNPAQAEHAVVSGSPGQGARTMGAFKVAWPILLLVLLAGAIIGLAVPFHLPPLYAALSMVVVLAILGGVVMWSDRRLHRYVKGAEGEEIVARVLGFLPPGYHVFHSVWIPVGEAGAPSDVDHLVIGPTGVYAIETKNWRGTVSVEQEVVLVDGKAPSRSPLQQVYRGAREVRQVLDEGSNLLIKVCPVLCFASGDAEIEAEAAGVKVCDSGKLIDVLVHPRGEDLSADKIERLVEFMKTR